jgi:hypothetical protein
VKQSLGNYYEYIEEEVYALNGRIYGGNIPDLGVGYPFKVCDHIPNKVIKILTFKAEYSDMQGKKGVSE